MKDHKPLVSVIMATFNESPEFVEGAIRSILNQTYSNFELFVLDDSTDIKTRKAIDKVAHEDTRINVVRKDKRMGFVPALNEGLKRAKGEFIARMDGDDYSLPQRFQTQVEYFLENPDIDILGGGINIMNENGVLISHRSYPIKGMKLKLFSIFRCPLAHPTVMIRKSSLKSLNYDESFKKAEDIEFWLRLRNNGLQINNLDVPLLNYRIMANMGNKRDHSQFKSLLRARIKNIKLKYMFVDMIAILITSIYSILPLSFISFIYSVENKDRH